MCGIVGYIGDENAAPILVNGLKKLEYRGYDSAGIAIFGSSGLKIIKCKGRLAALEEKVGKSVFRENKSTGKTGLNDGVNVLRTALDGCMGIGHTRWATHGEPNDVNSHPHTSRSGRIAVVHNGIIENYMKLKDFLESQGFRFVSDTDTETVAHLVEYHYRGDLVQAVMESISEIEGSYALGVICEDCPDRFVAARKDSPLVIGLGRNCNFIASDIPAILEHTREVYLLEDREIAEVRKDGVRVFNIHGAEVRKNVFHVDWDAASAEKSGYEHFMMKEISEEPKVLKDTINSRLMDGRIVLDNIKIMPEDLENIEKIFIVACGTAYHAGVVGKYIMEKLVRIPVEVDLASEFRYRDPIVGSKHLVIIISQSGETLDTLFALREAKKRGARVLSIVNVVGSSIARESDNVLYTCAGPEIAVASTKAYNTQLAALYLVALDFALKKRSIDDSTYAGLISSLKTLPSAVDAVLSNKADIQKFASEHFNARSIFFIGRGLDYALSMEGSLKLKEISYIHSEAYAGGELKHGTIALIENGTLVVCPMTQDYLIEKMISNLKEVKARGAVALAITQACNSHVAKVADMVVTIPDVHPLFAPVVAVTPMQLFAYYVAVQKGCDVDKPRNLAKSVTVE